MAIARGREKEDLAKRCGDHHYMDSTSSDTGEARWRQRRSGHRYQSASEAYDRMVTGQARFRMVLTTGS